MTYQEFCEMIDKVKNNDKLTFKETIEAVILLAIAATTVDKETIPAVYNTREKLLEKLNDPVAMLPPPASQLQSSWLTQCDCYVVNDCRCINVNLDNKENK